MSRPTPDKTLQNKFIGSIINNGGSVGIQKLFHALNWSQADYEWVMEHLLQEGIVRRGRGRGGSLQLVNPEDREKAAEIQNSKTPNPKGRPKKEITEGEFEEEEFNLEEYKSKFVKLPDDPNAFKPGMKVYRLPSNLYLNESFAWRHMNSYVVDKVEDETLFVYPYNIKGAESMSTRPVRFYVRT